MYRFIDAEKTTYPVRLLCRLLGVGHSAFYQWLRAGRQRATDRERHDRARVELTRQAWSEHRGVYGARRLTAELHERGHRWNRKAVARLMRLAGIEGAHRRRRGKPRRKAASTATAPDLVQRQFSTTAPNRLWVADISYLRTWEGFLYLAVVVDAYSRRVVGWAMADHLRTELILDAVGMAIQHRRPAREQLVHHSDRGTQGEFKWSSQHLDQGVWHGKTCRLGNGGDRPPGDAFAGSAGGERTSGDAAAVLAADR
ncbi:IS3 family transposase [Micromonospora tulbaghiae]|uniref:IS3 family transposase n=1 Tax=Micromonospora tulbaghiae TaxID=479978 RepID=UPI0033EA7E42